MKQLDNPSDNLELNVVIGNESCDLDSNIGSIMMAYLSSVKQFGVDIFDVKNINNLYIPMISQNEEFYFETKHEIIHYFNLFGFTEDELKDILIFTRSIKFKLFNQIKNHKINVTLFDHNEVDIDELKFNKNWNIVMIYDHHHAKQELKVPHKINQPLGSCTTQAGEIIMELWHNNSIRHLIGGNYLKFIQGPIVFDTSNFKPKLYNKKWTDKDLDVFNFINKHTVIENEEREFVAKQNSTVVKPKSKGMSMQHNVMRDFKAFDQVWEKTLVKIGIASWHDELHARYFNFYDADYENLISTQRDLEQSRKLDLLIMKSGPFIMFVSDHESELMKKVINRVFKWEGMNMGEYHKVSDKAKAFYMQAMKGKAIGRKKLVELLNQTFTHNVQDKWVRTEL